VNNLRGVLANLPLRLSVNEAAPTAVRLCRTRSAHRRGAVTTKTSTKAEEDCGQEEARRRGPSKPHEVATNVGFKAG
jgi:hypothetical protein